MEQFIRLCLDDDERTLEEAVKKQEYVMLREGIQRVASFLCTCPHHAMHSFLPQ